MEWDWDTDHRQRLKTCVVWAATIGNADQLVALLSGESQEVIAEVLHDGAAMATAISKGHTKVVEVLLNDFGVDPNDEVYSIQPLSFYENYLCLAAEGDHVDIINVLLNAGADIDLRSSRGETALHRACRCDHLRTVECLVAKGARTDLVDNCKYTCLMHACKKRNKQMAEFLLRNGADPNQSACNGRTALHVAAICDAPEAAEVLLAYGARISMDDFGFTPTRYAVILDSSGVIDLFLVSPAIPRHERIAGLELLAAITSEAQEAYQYLHGAMTERYSDPTNILSKPSRQPVPALGNITESQTLEELESRKSDHCALLTECVLILERTLGGRHVATGKGYLRVCDALVSQGRCSEATRAWIYGWKKSRKAELMDEYSNTFSFLLSQMKTSGSVTLLREVTRAMDVLITDLEWEATSTKKDEVYAVLTPFFSECCLYMTEIILDAEERPNETKQQLEDLVKRLIDVYPLLSESSSLLHYAIGDSSRGRDRPRDANVVKFILDCGADVAAVDSLGNTPLHRVALSSGVHGVEDACSITRVLLEAGAHVDARNKQGQTPLNVASTQVRAVLRECYPLPLTCLAASAAINHGVSYESSVPTIVQDFIKLHSLGQ